MDKEGRERVAVRLAVVVRLTVAAYLVVLVVMGPASPSAAAASACAWG